MGIPEQRFLEIERYLKEFRSRDLWLVVAANVGTTVLLATLNGMRMLRAE
ncbi:MAG: hypothetical protein ACRETD_10395 [Steroidobacteraceae bacterium]